MNKIFKKIDKVGVVSFDIFDTLIKRNCLKPSDIFDLVEKTYNKNNLNKIANFKQDRIMAENKAREQSEGEDININDIYDCLDGYEKNVQNELKNLEIEIELRYCIKNQKMYEVYEYAKSKNKKIICISDMYLPKTIIKQILNQNGYYIEDIYVSSEIKKLKRTGNLFRFVIDELKIDKKKILHIGDSVKSDYLRPKMLGMKSYLIKKNEKNTEFISCDELKDLEMKIMYSFINNNVIRYENYYNKIGYELLGPLTYGYCKWLHKNIIDMALQKVFFCARDMKLIQQVYNIIYKEKAVKNEYMYISRKSIRLPFLYKNNSFEDFMSVITDKKMYIKDILSNNGIELNEYEKIMQQYNLEVNHKYNNETLINNSNFKELYEKELVKTLKESSKKQFENFNKYLDRLEYNENSALVDLGWKGTIQYSLIKTYKNTDREKVKGFYFGLEKKSYNELNQDNSYTYIFDKNSKNDYEEKIYSFRSLFEIFFSAQHGSTLRYDENGYLLGNPDNIDNEYIEKIQEGALRFIEDFSNYYEDVDNIEINELLESLLELGINPTLKQAKIFGDLNFDNLILGKLAKPKKLYYYMIHPKQLKNDIFLSEWKIGFLKRLFIIRLPYYKFYNFLKKLRNGEK